MPYDSNGNHSLPISYFVENGDTVLPVQHNPPLEDISQALGQVILRSGVAPMSGDLKMGTNKVTDMAPGTASTDGATKGQLDAETVRYVTKAANYTAVAADNAAFMRFTAAATLSLTAAATLATGWWMVVVADGGNVTIDPNASEVIDAGATLVVPNGTSVMIVCDGTAFFTSKLPIPASRQIIAGNGLTGGGTLAADRTVTMGTPGTLTASSANAVQTTSHTHDVDSTGIVAAGTAALASKAVGTYIFGLNTASTTRTPGDTIAGSSIRAANAAAQMSDTMGGTWMCMGYTDSGAAGSGATTLWKRVS